MRIKQYGRKIISNKEISEIINLMKKDNKNFKYNDVTEIIIWNSKLLYKLYMEFLLETVTVDYIEVMNNTTKAAYHDLKKNIHIYLFNSKIDYMKKYDIKDQKEMIQSLKLAVTFQISHEFRHNYQTIFAPHKYLQDKINYRFKEWKEHWIEKDAMKYSRCFMLNNQKRINDILGIKFKWLLEQ